MASENNLNAVFTDIANSIRAKKGTTNTIKPINMADEINSIEVGGSSGVSVKDFITTRNAKNLFYSCSKLTDEQLASILKYDDTSGVTDMSYMFQYCSSLTTIPQLDTSNVTNMDTMFGDCKALTSIPFLDTSKVTDMSSMFRSCLLTTIPQLDTSKVLYMSQMFSGCSKLENIPQLDTSSCLRMASMFQKCNKLTTIPQLDTRSCTQMDDMFFGCNSLTSIPQLDTSKVTYMYEMFYGCSSLVVIPQLDTSKVTNMGNMFYNCGNLILIPPFDTSSCSSMYNMFISCSKLEKIDITKLADGTSNNHNFANGCYSLKTLAIRTMDTIPALNSDAFNNCYHFYGTTNATYNPNGLKDGRIYVPDDKVESLKTATNWSVFADIIKPLSEYVEEHSKLFIDSSTLSLTTSRNVTIYLYGFTNTPTVNINVSNENIAQISNITVTTEKITFEVIALGGEGNAIISININGDYSEELSVEVSYIAPIEHRVEQISGATYGFALNSNEYYESTNKKVTNSYSLCKLVFNAGETNKILKLECINNGENGYDFGILSKIDTTLSLSNNEDTGNVYKSFKNQSSLNPVTITYPETTVGEHFIYIKYRKDGSGDTGNDSLQFKVIS